MYAAHQIAINKQETKFAVWVFRWQKFKLQAKRSYYWCDLLGLLWWFEVWHDCI